MAAQIVVTGFEPWAHGTENPTLEVLDQLRASNDIEGDLRTVRLPVESNKLADITVERIAANVMDFPIPDNVGAQHGGNPVFEGGPAAHMATLPVKTIATELRKSVPAKISNSPSTYLCNQMMY